MKISLKRMFLLWTFLFMTISYLELVFKMSLLIIRFNDELGFMFGFSFVYSLIVLFFLLFFKPKTIKRLVFVFVILLTFMFLMQDVYHTVVETFYSIQVAGDFSLGLSFIGDAFLALRIRHLLYVLPLISLIFINIKFKHFYEADYMFLKQPLIVLSIAFLSLSIVTGLINDNRIEDGINIMFTDKDLYDFVYDTQLTVKSFGLVTYVYRDVVNVFQSEPLRETEYNILIDNYLNSRPSHKTNEMTGVLEDKNLILIMAESFDTFAIHEDLTPTLYALKNDHISFSNYYSPLYYRSTADTEWMTQTSLYPNKNVTLTMEAYIDNTLPNTLPNLFESRGYETFSYHNYIDYFYPRTEVHQQLFGYNTFKGAEALGLMNEVSDGSIIFNHEWQRDFDLIDLTVDDFINEDKFFVNYVTVSGHFNYDADHEVVSHHIDALNTYVTEQNLDLPEDILYYLATAMELNLAVETLMNRLNEANKLEDTVIMIYGDHYAYAINEQTIWNYDTVKTDGDALGLHNVPMLMYAPNTSLNGTYDMMMSSIDIMPTIANLFDLPMIYEFAFGMDIFDERLHLVRFANMSYRSKHFHYDALTESYEFFDDVYTPIDLFELSQQIINDYRYNTLILDYDYFEE